MKIILLTSFFPPTHIAGTEKRTLGYSSELSKLGHQVQVVCAATWDQGDHYWNGYRDEIYQDISVRRIYLNWILAPNPNEYLYRNPIIAHKLVNWLNGWRPDIVHITSCYTLSASVIEAIHELSIPIVLTLTDYWFICPKHTLLRSNDTLCDGLTSNRECLDCMLSGNRKFHRLNQLLSSTPCGVPIEFISRKPRISSLRGLRGMALDMGDRKKYLKEMIDIPEVVIAPSIHLREILQSNGISRQIQVIYSGHDLTWSSARTPSDDNGCMRFGYIGQITPNKGVHILLSAFTESLFSGYANLTIYGDQRNESAYADQLQSLIKGREASIRFKGGFSPDQIGRVLSEIDVLIVPSQWQENNPRVIQEAFASVTPIVASNVGGIAEFVKHEVNGLIFERNNVDDLSSQMYRFIDEPELVSRLRSGIGIVKTLEAEIGELLGIYESLIISGLKSTGSLGGEN